MVTVEITQADARKLVLQAQGLSNAQESSLEAIRQLSYIQIDTISVAERAHHHVFFTRNENYQKEYLDQMVADRSVFEYWSHAAAFLPIEDYQYSLYQKAEIQKADKFWFDKDKKVMRKVLKRIEAEGPLQSKDFEKTGTKKSAWGDQKPAKIALQILFMEGKLMISERQGFQKVYDLAERVFPDANKYKKPTQKAYCNYLIDRALTAQGLATESEIAYLRKGLKKPLASALSTRVRQKEVIPVKIEGQPEVYYAHEDQLIQLENEPEDYLHILSPFDNLVIQRNRLTQIFNFDYQIECYVPEKKRQFGYYCLPILYGDKFVGRLDPKADRKTKTFYIKRLWFENDFIPHDDFCLEFATKVKAFAKFCGCDEVVLDRVSPTTYKSQVKNCLKDG